MSQLKRRKQDNSFEVVGDHSLPIRMLADGTPSDDDYVAIDKGSGARKTTIASLFGSLLTTISATVFKFTNKYLDASGVWDSTLASNQADVNANIKKLFRAGTSVSSATLLSDITASPSQENTYNGTTDLSQYDYFILCCSYAGHQCRVPNIIPYVFLKTLGNTKFMSLNNYSNAECKAILQYVSDTDWKLIVIATNMIDVQAELYGIK